MHLLYFYFDRLLLLEVIYYFSTIAGDNVNVDADAGKESIVASKMKFVTWTQMVSDVFNLLLNFYPSLNHSVCYIMLTISYLIPSLLKCVDVWICVCSWLYLDINWNMFVMFFCGVNCPMFYYICFFIVTFFIIQWRLSISFFIFIDIYLISSEPFFYTWREPSR